MTGLYDALARLASPILLAVGFLLAAGALLVVLGQPVVGWTIYGAGYVGTIAASLTLLALRQRPLGPLARSGLSMLMAGIVLGFPVMLMVWGFYAQDAQVHDLLMPYATTPVGMLAGPLAWIGLALFGLASLRDRTLPTGAAALLVSAAVLAVPVELGLLSQAAWATAFVLLSIALAWTAGTTARQASTVVA